MDEIVRLHEFRESLFAQMEATDDRPTLFDLGQMVEQCEFDLQKAWKFKQDRRYHSWWFRVPKCACPKMDNYERVGATDQRIINLNCPVHGYAVKN